MDERELNAIRERHEQRCDFCRVVTDKGACDMHVLLAEIATLRPKAEAWDRVRQDKAKFAIALLNATGARFNITWPEPYDPDRETLAHAPHEPGNYLCEAYLGGQGCADCELWVKEHPLPGASMKSLLEPFFDVTSTEGKGRLSAREAREFMDARDRETLARMEAPESVVSHEKVMDVARTIVRRDDPEASDSDVEGMARQLADIFRERLAAKPEGEPRPIGGTGHLADCTCPDCVPESVAEMARCLAMKEAEWRARMPRWSEYEAWVREEWATKNATGWLVRPLSYEDWMHLYHPEG